MTRAQNRTAGSVPSPADWGTYFDGLSGPQAFFRAQAEEYVRNLRNTIPLQGHTRVLDVGSGYGFVAQALAPHVGEICAWDSSRTMQDHLRRIAESIANVSVLDLSADAADPAPFDLILVNSTVQYMQPAEFRHCLARWAGMLRSTGALILSDLIPTGHSLVADMTDLLTFTTRRGQARNALVWALQKLGRYRRVKGTSPLQRVSIDRLRSMAAAAGLAVTILPKNLTHFTRRYSVVLTRVSRG